MYDHWRQWAVGMILRHGHRSDELFDRVSRTDHPLECPSSEVNAPDDEFWLVVSEKTALFYSFSRRRRIRYLNLFIFGETFLFFLVVFNAAHHIGAQAIHRRWFSQWTRTNVTRIRSTFSFRRFLPVVLRTSVSSRT